MSYQLGDGPVGDGVVMTVSAEAPGRAKVTLTVVADDGAWTDGAHAELEAGNELEFTLPELQWLRDEAIPAAIQRLTELAATGQAATG